MKAAAQILLAMSVLWAVVLSASAMPLPAAGDCPSLPALEACHDPASPLRTSQQAKEKAGKCLGLFLVAQSGFKSERPGHFRPGAAAGFAKGAAIVLPERPPRA